MDSVAKLPRWARRPDIVSYIVECYAGTELKDGCGRPRRLYMWYRNDGEVMMGNTEAFLIHLVDKYELVTSSSAGAAVLHKLLRLMGETLWTNAARQHRGQKTGKYKQPEPEEWLAKISH